MGFMGQAFRKLANSISQVLSSISRIVSNTGYSPPFLLRGMEPLYGKE
jgi:hypothetical protein